MNAVNGTLVEFRNLFNQMSVGFDDYWIPREKGSNYPPYNLIEESKNIYRIEMAVAGFSKDSIEIFEEEGKLTIVGDRNEEDASVKSEETTTKVVYSSKEEMSEQEPEKVKHNPEAVADKQLNLLRKMKILL